MRPSTGILPPGISTTINVVLQSGPNVQLLLNKDKFLVMCMQIDDINASQHDIADIWKVRFRLIAETIELAQSYIHMAIVACVNQIK